MIYATAGRKKRTNYFFKKEPRRFICCENILTISPAKANMTQNFQKMDEPDSRSIERNAINETKKSRIACMAIPEKEEGRPFYGAT